jgi:hypothetical protein
MEILNLQLGAGAIQQYRKAGAYVEIISSVYPVTLNFYSTQGGQINQIQGALSGLFLSADFGGGFDVSNVGQAAQSVQLLVCDAGEIGGSRRQPGNVRVIDEITESILTTSQIGTTAITPFSTAVIVAPGGNVNGMIVRMADIGADAGAGGNTYATVVACKSAPTSFTAPAQQYRFCEVLNTAGPQIRSVQRQNKLLPKGWGLYLNWNIGTTASLNPPGAIVQYELL